MGELLPSRNRQQGVSGARRLHSRAGAPVVAFQAQSQATQGRELSTLAPLRALRARTSRPAWARRVVDEGVRSCPRAGCGRSARPVEIQASDASAAIVGAATITLPPRTIGLRILDREGREVLVDRRPTADRAMDCARSSPRGRNRRTRQLRRRAHAARRSTPRHRFPS